MTDLEALRIARNQVMIRMVQLSGCRVCGAEQQKYQQAIERLDNLIHQLENRRDLPIQ